MYTQNEFEKAIIHEVITYCKDNGIEVHSLARKVGYTNTEKFREFFLEGTCSMSSHTLGKVLALIRRKNDLPTVYISGPRVAEKKFQGAEHFLRSQNYNIVNPMKLQHEHGGTWEEFMREDISALIKCDIIYMLKGWEDSRGAKIEKKLAEDLSIKVITQD